MTAEKNTLTEALHEAENRMRSYERRASEHEYEMEQQREDCRIFTRLNDQRRQENMALQARLSSLESRYRDLLLQQGAAVSGTALALSALTSRIDGFVEQLVISYSISDKDLEVK